MAGRAVGGGGSIPCRRINSAVINEPDAVNLLFTISWIISGSIRVAGSALNAIRVNRSIIGMNLFISMTLLANICRIIHARSVKTSIIAPRRFIEPCVMNPCLSAPWSIIMAVQTERPARIISMILNILMAVRTLPGVVHGRCKVCFWTLMAPKAECVGVVGCCSHAREIADSGTCSTVWRIILLAQIYCTGLSIVIIA